MQRVCTFIKKEHMIVPGQMVLVGISGGADSVALLRLFVSLKDELSISIEAVHIEHGIRGAESLRDQEFTEKLCASLDVPLTVCAVGEEIERLHAKEASLEACAREVRYASFEKIADAHEEENSSRVAIAVAHHADDNAETLLYHLARGSALMGMGAMQPVRGRIIRPFLCVTKEEILTYLKEIGQSYCLDSTNEDRSYDRNRIRLDILPQLTQMNAQAVTHLNRESQYLREAAAHIRAEAEAVLSEAVEGDLLFEEPLRSCDGFLRREVIYLWLASFMPGAKDIATVHVDALCRLLDLQTGRSVNLPGGRYARRDYRGLRMCRDEDDPKSISFFSEQSDVCIRKEDLMDGQMHCYHIADMTIRMQVFSCERNAKIPYFSYTKWFDYDKISSDIRLRTRMSGDYLLTRMDGGRQLLQDYFVNEKVPAQDRNAVLLVAEEHHILWAVGYRISSFYKIEDATRHILSIEISQAP